MSDEMLRAFKAARAMEPIAQVGHYVKIVTYKDSQFRQVTFREAISPFQVLDIGAIAAQTVSARTNAGNLDLNDDDFGQWRWFPLDNVFARIFNPAGVSKMQLKFIQTGVEKSIIYRDPTLLSTEFYTWEDERPAFEGMNFSDYALNACRFIILGYRYKTVEIADNDYIIIEGPQRGQIIKRTARDNIGLLRVSSPSTEAIPLNSGEMPRVVKALDALAMKLVPTTLVVCAGNP
ncbi:MAG: hypothetical protein KAR06_03015 [Deltaproteobacteria bacterium]|nr:hypothetical protein [Deltaproteobacteria bacterium]